MAAPPKEELSRLWDGRICWLGPSRALVWDPKTPGAGWGSAKGVTVGMILDSKPLTDADMASLALPGTESQ